jgi:hypothetical protein
MTETVSNITPAEPRRFSIRLPRPLWIGLAAAVFAVVATAIQVVVPVWRQQVAIREIERLGGRITIEHGGPEWLRQKLGDERMTYFDKVVKVDLTVNSVTDPALQHIEALGSLKVLWLGNTRITDDGLIHLRGLNSLNQLWIGNTRITDAGLVHLARLSNLQDLSFANTRVTDAGLVHLKGLHRLRYLWVGSTPVTDAGVAELRRALPDLKIVR